MRARGNVMREVKVYSKRKRERGETGPRLYAENWPQVGLSCSWCLAQGGKLRSLISMRVKREFLSIKVRAVSQLSTDARAPKKYHKEINVGTRQIKMLRVSARPLC